VWNTISLSVSLSRSSLCASFISSSVSSSSVVVVVVVIVVVVVSLITFADDADKTLLFLL